MAIKIFTEPERGRKKCPASGCPNYVAAITKKCPCGHEFVSGNKPTPVTKKIAAKLSSAVGDTQKPEPKPEPALFGRNRGGAGIMQTMVPAGACPAKLKSTDQAAVYEWIVKVLKAKEDSRTVLMASALKYYVREFYEITGKGEDYNIVCNHIDSYWAGGEIDREQEEIEENDFNDEDAEDETETEIKEEDFDWNE